MHRLTILITSLGLTFATACVAAEPVMIQNLDGDLTFVGDTPEESKAKLEGFIDNVHASGVTSLMWSIGAGSDILYYPTEVASVWGWRETTDTEKPAYKKRIERIRAAMAAGLDGPRIAGERARSLGMAFYPSYRVNDNHYCIDPLNHPLTGRFWLENQDADIGPENSPIPGEPSFGYLLNYAREDVRAYRQGVIFEAMERYADLMDGFEIDFARFQVMFPAGEAERYAPVLTRFMEECKAKLDAIAKEQGRSMKLVVRVPTAIRNCTWAGIEIEEWITRRVVDVVIPTQNLTLAYDLPLDEFVRIAEPAGVEVYGAILGRGGFSQPFTDAHRPGAYAAEPNNRRPGTPERLASARNQVFLGADGVQLYNVNLFATDPAEAKKILTAMRDDSAFARMDRRYIVTQSHYRDNTDTYEYRKQLPLALEPGKPARVRVLISEDLAESTPGPRYVALRIGLHGADRAYEQTAMNVKINGKIVHDGEAAEALVVTTGPRKGITIHPATEAYAQWPISELSLLRKGWNDVEVTMSPTYAGPTLLWVEAEIGVLGVDSAATAP